MVELRRAASEKDARRAAEAARTILAEDGPSGELMWRLLLAACDVGAEVLHPYPAREAVAHGGAAALRTLKRTLNAEESEVLHRLLEDGWDGDLQGAVLAARELAK